MQRPGGDDLPCVFSGTLVVHGQGVAVTKETGAFSEIGRIGKALQGVEQEQTPLQKETGSIVRAIFVGALVLCAALVVVYGLTRRDWLNGLLSGITLAMAVLPEEFPVVLTIFLALGAWRISRNNVLARRMAAVETLGAATVLCTDKTGTLTQNQMRIRMLRAGEKSIDVTEEPGDLPEAFHELLEYGVLACQQDPFDPMEKAILEVGAGKLTNTEHIHSTWTLAQQYPLSRDLLALSHAWRSMEGHGYVVATKGAPEAIADLCHLDAERQALLSVQVQEMADKGLRVIGVAKASFGSGNLPDAAHDFPFEPLGIIGLEDPVRPTVPAAVNECNNAGIKVVMITGDYPATAQKIARQIGLGPGDTITGPELARLSAEELTGRVEGASIFARVVPEQKLAIVDAFKARGEIVAMTGDGVNDAPALKSAHIGVAMGSRGTDVAREASDLVLLDDDFSSIVKAVRMGRRIFDNLRKAMAYVISVHIPIALTSLLPGAPSVERDGPLPRPYRVSRAHHRPRLLHCLRGRARGSGCHETEAARAGGAPVWKNEPPHQLPPGARLVRGGDGRVLRSPGHRAEHRGGQDPRVHHAHRVQPLPDPDKPQLVPIRCLRLQRRAIQPFSGCWEERSHSWGWWSTFPACAACSTLPRCTSWTLP